MHPALARLHTFIRVLDNVNERVGKFISWLTVVMVVVTFSVVVLRYALDLGWVAMQESVRFMHATVFMLGAGYTLKADGHVRVDILYLRWSKKTRAWIDLTGALLLLAPVALYILFSSWGYVETSWSIKESSREAGGLPGIFLLKTAIPIMAILLLIQGIAQALRSLAEILENSPDRP